MPVLSIVLGDQFGQDLAAPVERIRPVNTGCGYEDNLVDAGGGGGFEDLEGATHIQVKKIVDVFLAAVFVDAVPGGDVDNAVTSANYLRQRQPVHDGPLDKHRSLFQMPWRANVENDRRVAPAEQPGHESLGEISRPAGQQHLHTLLPNLPALHRQYGGRPDHLSA
jgi:hypothetical protein